MSRPPNPYRDRHRRLTTEGNNAAGRGDYAESQRYWNAAAALKAQGVKEIDDGMAAERERRLAGNRTDQPGPS